MSRKCARQKEMSKETMKDTRKEQLQKATLKRLIEIQYISQVAHQNTVRIVLSQVEKHELRAPHMDKKYAFLNGFLQKEVYIKKLLRYKVKSERETRYYCWKY